MSMSTDLVETTTVMFPELAVETLDVRALL